MTKYSDIPIPPNACHYRIATHKIHQGSEEIKSRSYCRKLVEPGSEFCPRHAFLMRQKEADRIAREAAKKVEAHPESVLNI
jgi:hypothetical protein